MYTRVLRSFKNRSVESVRAGRGRRAARRSDNDDERARRTERGRLRTVRSAAQHPGRTEGLRLPAVYRQAGEAVDVFQTVLSKVGNREWHVFNFV